MVRWRHSSLLALAALLALPATISAGTLIPYAHYRLGEEDPGTPTVGQPPETGLSYDEIKYGGAERDLTAIGDPQYSDFLPPGGYSSLSMKFDGVSGLGGPSTQWHGQSPGSFRIGMEAWVWVDPIMEGTEFVPFANGSGMGFVGTATGEWTFYGASGGPPTPTGGAIAYGEWQHIAFATNGSQWNFYLDGDQTVETLGGNYGATSGDITIGGDLNGERRLTGYVDEARLFRWSNILPNQLAPQVDDFIVFASLTRGDVNGDDIVDASDYDVWRTNAGADVSELTALGRLALGDVNHDKLVNLDDFALIKANQTPGASPVPEPTTLALVCSAALVLGVPRLLRGRRIGAVAALVALGLSCGVASTANAQLTAQWDGTDGNWNDNKWTGGSGANGAPTSVDTAEFLTTGTATINTDVGAYAQLISRQGGTIHITPTGAAQFQDVNLGWNPNNGAGVLSVEGSLTVPGILSLARGNDGNGNASSTLDIKGSAVVRINEMDAFWAAPAATIAVTGPNADIQINTAGFGPSKLVANITAVGHSAIKAPTTTDIFAEGSAGSDSELEVHFDLGDFEPTLGHSWTLIDTPAFTNAAVGVTSGATFKQQTVDFLDAPGLRAVLNYRAGGANGQVLAVDVVSNLNLRVDTATGVATLENPTVGGGAFNIDGILITSASGSLNAAGFDGLGVAGWAPGLKQSGAVLSESNLLGSTSIATGASFDLGSIFSVGSGRDLVFQYHVVGGSSIRGTVQFDDGPVGPLGDTNDDGKVDLVDLNNVRNNFGAVGLGDTDNDNDVDLTDLNNVRNNFGAVGSQAVPEPSTAILSLGLGLALAGATWLRRKR